LHGAGDWFEKEQRIVAPGIESLIVTVCADVYVPPGGLNVGVAVWRYVALATALVE
jgi:hypothetical protein